MNLTRTRETGTIHKPECYRTKGSAIHWVYGDDIPDEQSLSAQTMYSPWLHLCRTCLPGICYCNRCQQGKAAKT